MTATFVGAGASTIGSDPISAHIACAVGVSGGDEAINEYVAPAARLVLEDLGDRGGALAIATHPILLLVADDAMRHQRTLAGVPAEPCR
jgi:hypothetical protein